MPQYIVPEVEYITSTPNPEAVIVRMARICYQTEPKGGIDNDIKLIRKLIKSGHTSQIEHATASFIICDRGVTHEFVRSRIGVAYSQESTRYCNYAQDRFDGSIRIVDPQGLTEEQLLRRHEAFQILENVYKAEVKEGVAAQIARGVLPTALRTQIGVTMDFRAWRWFLALRTSTKAHPQIREIAFPLWTQLINLAPNIFRTIPTVDEQEQIREDVCLTMPKVLANLKCAA